MNIDTDTLLQELSNNGSIDIDFLIAHAAFIRLLVERDYYSRVVNAIYALEHVSDNELYSGVVKALNSMLKADSELRRAFKDIVRASLHGKLKVSASCTKDCITSQLSGNECGYNPVKCSKVLSQVIDHKLLTYAICVVRALIPIMEKIQIGV